MTRIARLSLRGLTKQSLLLDRRALRARDDISFGCVSREIIRHGQGKTRAFSLLELLLYIALASVITLTASALLSSILQIREKSRAAIEVESQGVLLMQNLTQAIRNARDVTAPAPQTSSAGGMTLAMDEASANPTVFEVTGASIGIKEGAVATAVPLLSQNTGIKDATVKNLAVDADHPDEIKITFTLYYITQEKRGGFGYEKTFYGSASLRSVP